MQHRVLIVRDGRSEEVPAFMIFRPFSAGSS
jgi:hypothetical protein